MKSKYFIFSLVFAAFLSSYSPSGNKSLKINEDAPSISLTGSPYNEINLNNGKTKVVNFWSFRDPESRIRNNRLAGIAENESAGMELISICVDDNNNIPNQILTLDGIKASDNIKILMANQVDEDTFEAYKTSKALKMFVIDNNGKLMSVADSIEEIVNFIA